MRLIWVFLSLTFLVVRVAEAESPPVQVTWRLLDYVAVDYAGAVADGKVISEAEYAEMNEFASAARTRIEALPESEAKPKLIERAKALQSAIAARADSTEVARTARDLAGSLIAAYPIPMAPSAAPDPARGAALYQELCSSCHGASGDGHGPAAANLDPPPIAFTDMDRARERSIFGLYQVIEQGLDGTSMPSFSSLDAMDRWALAFYAGSLAFSESQGSEGEKLWSSNEKFREDISLQAAVTQTPAELTRKYGSGNGYRLSAYLRRHPSALQPMTGVSLSKARESLRDARDAYVRGDSRAARELALSAYLDHFEPIEPALAARDAGLLNEIERAMAEFRADIDRENSASRLEEDLRSLESLLARAEVALGSRESSSTSSFIGSFTILLREGLEALLLIVAMVAFLRKSDQGKTVPYVHAGWIVALLAGIGTWGIATTVIAVSGASRELTEGFGSVLAALVLLWVGVWMHGKGQADAWQKYIQEHIGRAIQRRSAWFLFALSFLVTYREVFETILFYAALWEQGNGRAVIGGALLAILSLAVIAVVMLRFSRRLPIGKFFSYSAILIAVLAVVLIGKGVSALQEAGYVSINPLAFVPRVNLLGISPSIEALGAQVAMAALLVFGFVWTSRRTTRGGAP